MNIHKIASRVANTNGQIRTAGKIEFVKDSGPVRRDIRVEGYEWSPESLRSLAKILWASQRAHSYAMAAFRIFSKMPSAQFSPDGLMGGRGYIQSIKDLRSNLASSVEVLSSFTDTIHDEINADHWRTAGESKEVSEAVGDAENVKANPEKFVESEYSEEVIENPDPDDFNPDFESGEEEESEEEDEGGFAQTSSKKEKPSSKQKKKQSQSALPTDESEQSFGKSDVEKLMHTTSSYDDIIKRKHVIQRVANSIQSIPGGLTPNPVYDHWGPAEGTGDFGAGYNPFGDAPSDDPTDEGMSSGVEETQYLYEGPDANGDGVTGYSNPTDGDSTVLKTSSERTAAVEGYSWLPGSRNEKNLDYYQRGLTEADIAWMHAHDAPDLAEVDHAAHDRTKTRKLSELFWKS
jgi:hypothetical protein